MTHRLEGNDPTRTHERLSPAEVKAMILGGDSAPDYREAPPLPDRRRLAASVATAAHKTKETPDGDDENMVWLTGERTMEESRDLAYREGRCWPCGREYDCCCQGCRTCPQIKMAPGKTSMAWAQIQVALGGRDPRGMDDA